MRRLTTKNHELPHSFNSLYSYLVNYIIEATKTATPSLIRLRHLNLYPYIYIVLVIGMIGIEKSFLIEILTDVTRRDVFLQQRIILIVDCLEIN